MRIRSLKPFVWHDEKVGAVSRDARLLFVGLITMADDDGRFRTLPAVICGHAYPYDDDAVRKVPRWLEELSDAGLVALYGDHYGCLPTWTVHQRISHHVPSLLPPPPGMFPAVSANGSGGIPE